MITTKLLSLIVVSTLIAIIANPNFESASVFSFTRGLTYTASQDYTDLQSHYSLVCDSVLDADGNILNSGDESFGKKQFKNIKMYVQTGSSNQLKKYFTDEIELKDYAINSFKAAGYLAVFFVFSFFSIIILIFCCCCKECCKCCCKCCKVKPGTRPYTGIKLYYPIVITLCCMALIIIASSIGLDKADMVDKSYSKTRCQILKTAKMVVIERISTQDVKWPGLAGIYNKLATFNSAVGTIKSDTQSTVNQGTPNIDTRKSTVASSIANLETDHTVGVPYTIAAIANGDIKYTASGKIPSAIGGAQILSSSTAFQYTINPLSSSGSDKPALLLTLLNSQHVLLDTRTTIETAIDSVADTIDTIETNGNSFATNIDTYSSKIGDAMTQVQDSIDSIADYGNQAFDETDDYKDYTDMSTTYLQAVYAAFLGISILISTLLVLGVVFKCYKLRFFLYPLCFILQIVMLITFILSTVFCVLSIAGYQGCDYLDTILTSYDELKNFLDDDSQAEDFKTCSRKLGGDGKILNRLVPDLQSYLDQLTTAENSMKELTTSSSTAKQNLDTIGTQANTDLTALTNRLVTVRDKNYFTVDGKNYLDHEDLGTALYNLDMRIQSQYFTGSNKVSVSVPIMFVPSYEECQTSPSRQQLEFQVYGSTTKEFDIGSVISTANFPDGKGYFTSYATSVAFGATSYCFPIGGYAKGWTDESYSGSASYWDSTNSKDYQGLQSAFYNMITGDVTASGYLNQILAWRDLKNVAYGAKISQLNQVQVDLKAFLTDANTYVGKVNSYLSNTGTTSTNYILLEEDFTNPSSPVVGLIPALDCRFIGDELDDIYDIVCYTIVANFIQFFVVIALVSFGMFFGSIFIFVSALRFRQNSFVRFQIQESKAKQLPLQNL